MTAAIANTPSSDSDLLLVFAPFDRLVVSMENVGIEYIAAYARAKGFRANIVNAGLHGLSTADTIAIVRRSRFKVLGLSTIHWNLAAALRIAEESRKAHPESHIILGGVEAALNAEAILPGHPYVDTVCMGEGEITVSALLRELSRGGNWKNLPGLVFREGRRVKFTAPLPLIGDLNSLPHPVRDDMAAVVDAGGPVSISSSRGCFGRCSFCSVRAFYDLSPGAAWRGRSPASVVNEMREIHETYGAVLFSFIDETVVGPGESGRERLIRLARLIKESGMNVSFFMTIRADQVESRLFMELKEAGLRKVEIGIESIAASQLRRYGKTAGVEQNIRALEILEDLGLGVEIFMIPFDSELSEVELRENLRFYRSRFDGKCRYDVAPLSLANYLYPYPGTRARELYEKSGWLQQDDPVRFRALDKAIERIGQTVTAFIALFEPAFPMSFSGLGNLWINSASLPAPLYARICEICAEYGRLAVRFADWALSAVSLQPSAESVQTILAGLRGFVGELASLQQETEALTKNYGSDLQKPGFRIQNPFAEELYEFGRDRKKLLRRTARDGCFDEDDTITTLLNLIVREPWT